MATVLATPTSKPLIKRGMSKPVENFLKQSTRRVDISTGKERLVRLNRHHEAMEICMGGIYPCPEVVQAVLAPVPGETKRILDIGCGSRVWAIGMAKEFPHADVVGLDVPQAVKHWEGEYPPNCSFEAIDFQFAMPEKFLESFDLIHLRFIASAFTYFQKSMEEIQMCLKPGGLLILVDSTGEVLDQDQKTILPMRSRTTPNGSQLQRLFHEIRHTSSALGLDEFMMRATLQDGLWEMESLDDCGAAELLVPIGPWVTHENPALGKKLKQAGRLMRQCLQNVLASHHTMLENHGLPAATSDEWQKVIKAEINDPQLKMLLDVRVLWGRRRAAEDLPAPPLSPVPSSSRTSTPTNGPKTLATIDESAERENKENKKKTTATNKDIPRFASPYLRVFKTQRGWQQVTENRRKVGEWIPDPVPYVYRKHHNKRRGSDSPR